MKKILFMLPLLAVALVSCNKDNGDELSGDDIIQFKDQNFLNALLTVQEIDLYDADTDDWIPYTMDVDKNKDGQISVNEAKEVKGLILYDYETYEIYNITDMSEIKYFTSLTYLECYGNQIVSLDLSNNVALTYLECTNNPLKTLDVSGCTNLVCLNCSNNQLASLDLSSNIVLTDLYCAGNKLASLDLSNNTALICLFCQYNQLAALDLSNNTSLTELYCYSNPQLTALDVSMCHDLDSFECSRYNNYDGGYEIYYDTKCPLESLKIYKYHRISDADFTVLEKLYGDIIEYVE